MKLRPSTFFGPWLAMSIATTSILMLERFPGRAETDAPIDHIGSAIFALFTILAYAVPLAAVWPFFIKYCPRPKIKSPFFELAAGALLGFLIVLIFADESMNRLYLRSAFSLGGAILALTYWWLDKKIPQRQELSVLLRGLFAWLGFWIIASLLANGMYYLLFRLTSYETVFGRVVLALLLVAAVWPLLLRIVFALKAKRPWADAVLGAVAGVATSFLVTHNLSIGGARSMLASAMGCAVGAFVFWLISVNGKQFFSEEQSALRRGILRIIAFWIVATSLLIFLIHVRYLNAFSWPVSVRISMMILLAAFVWPAVDFAVSKLSIGRPRIDLVAGLIIGFPMALFLKTGGVWLVFSCALACMAGAGAFWKTSFPDKSFSLWAEWNNSKRAWAAGIAAAAIMVCWFSDAIWSVNRDQLLERDGILRRGGIFFEINAGIPFNGIAANFHKNGEKASVAHFKDGYRDGLETIWRENGQKAFENYYKDGKQDGLSTYWHDNGQKGTAEHYKDGKQDGLSTSWEDNGEKSLTTHYKDGKQDGLRTFWRESGQILSEECYEKGAKVALSNCKPTTSVEPDRAALEANRERQANVDARLQNLQAEEDRLDAQKLEEEKEIERLEQEQESAQRTDKLTIDPV